MKSLPHRNAVSRTEPNSDGKLLSNASLEFPKGQIVLHKRLPPVVKNDPVVQKINFNGVKA